MTSHILIIDDDTELTDLLVQYLEPEGFNVSCVHDGESGVKKALNKPFDAIILDVMLPKLNGFEVREKDINKQKLAESHGYKYYVIWSRDNVEESINNIIKIIENENKKNK